MSKVTVLMTWYAKSRRPETRTHENLTRTPSTALPPPDPDISKRYRMAAASEVAAAVLSSSHAHKPRFGVEEKWYQGYQESRKLGNPESLAVLPPAAPPPPPDARSICQIFYLCPIEHPFGDHLMACANRPMQDLGGGSWPGSQTGLRLRRRAVCTTLQCIPMPPPSVLPRQCCYRLPPYQP